MNENSKLIEFMPEHLLLIDPVYGFQNNEKALHAGGILKKGGPCTTLIYNRQVAVCGGLRILWPGNAESWMYLSKTNNGPHVLKIIRDWLNETIEKNKLDRVTAIIPVGDMWDHTERFLGFTQETILRKFGPNGIDKALYSRIR